MNKELKSVKSKIAKLIALSESMNLAEASVAMAKAAQLMSEWALTVDDIEIANDDIIITEIDTGRRQRPELYGLMTPLAKFCNVRAWNKRSSKYITGSTHKIGVSGYEADVEMYKDFWGVLADTFQREYETFKTTPEFTNSNAHGRALRKAFCYGFTNGVISKIDELIEENGVVVTKSGTAIVPLKGANIDKHLKENGMAFTMRTNTSRITTTTGIASGNTAGQSVSLSRPINGGKKVQMITA